ncbi:MAG: TetR/AcrR family transcriptional regulator [Leuconostoc carnosum]|uniref:TetR/AcrR family transcriptional regulator n=1 Tax=Leuconostoc carnosum TaxID=1252 RepID=UPI003F9BCC9C
MSDKTLTKKSEIKKLAILNNARKVFSKKGFSAVTMQDIIEACGISRGGIYLYFTSVDDIFFETMTQRSVHQFDKIREAVIKQPSFEQILNDYLLEHKNRLLNHMANGCSLLRAMYEYSFTHHSDRDRSLKQKQVNATKATVRSILDLGVKQGKIDSHDIKIIADNFMFIIEGMSILALTGELKEKQIDDQFEMFIKKLF